MNLNVSRLQKHVSKRKYFRYPPILPIVYYEGKDSWTADMHLRDRIWNGIAFGSYIPDFVYEVVRNHDYTNAELLEKKDEISLIMMISKIQSADDLREFLQSPKDEVDRILKNTTPSIRRTIRDTLISLVERKLAKGQTEEQIAEDLFASVEYIRELRDKNK